MSSSPDLRAQETYLSLRRTTAAVDANLAALFKKHGLSDSSYGVLRILRSRGPNGATCGDLGRELVVRVPDVTRLVDRLLQKGLVERQRAKEDRRVVTIRLTARGKRLITRLEKPVAQAHQEVLGHLTDAEITRLLDLLAKARGNTNGDHAPRAK